MIIFEFQLSLIFIILKFDFPLLQNSTMLISLICQNWNLIIIKSIIPKSVTHLSILLDYHWFTEDLLVWVSIVALTSGTWTSMIHFPPILFNIGDSYSPLEFAISLLIFFFFFHLRIPTIMESLPYCFSVLAELGSLILYLLNLLFGLGYWISFSFGDQL